MPGDPPDLLTQAHNRWRDELLRREQQQAKHLINAFGYTISQIDAAIFKLHSHMIDAQAKGDFSPSWQFQEDRLLALEQQCLTQINYFSQFAGDTITTNQQAFIDMAQDMAQQVTLAQLPPGVEVQWSRLHSAAVADLVGYQATGSPLRDLLNQQGTEASQRIRASLVSGIALGRNPKVTASIIKGDLNGDMTRAVRIARTETLRSYNEAALRSFRANSDVVEAWIWIADLSDRTCPVCLSMHGTEHPLSEPFASHVSCRCTAAPTTVTYESLLGGNPPELTGPNGETGDDLVKFLAFNADEDQAKALLGDDLYKEWDEGLSTKDALAKVQAALTPKETRLSIKDSDNGVAWFDKQSEEAKKKIVGPGKLKLLDEGFHSLRDLVGYRVDPVWGPERFELPLKIVSGAVPMPAGVLWDTQAIYPPKLAGAWDKPPAAPAPIINAAPHTLPGTVPPPVVIGTGVAVVDPASVASLPPPSAAPQAPAPSGFVSELLTKQGALTYDSLKTDMEIYSQVGALKSKKDVLNVLKSHGLALKDAQAAGWVDANGKFVFDADKLSPMPSASVPPGFKKEIVVPAGYNVDYQSFAVDASMWGEAQALASYGLTIADVKAAGWVDAHGNLIKDADKLGGTVPVIAPATPSAPSLPGVFKPGVFKDSLTDKYNQTRTYAHFKNDLEYLKTIGEDDAGALVKILDAAGWTLADVQSAGWVDNDGKIIKDADKAAAKAIKAAKPKVPKAPKVAPAVPLPLSSATEPPGGWANTILYQNTAPAAGSNKGGFYIGRDGIERYVKFYSDPSQAYSEQLANTIYRLLGIDAPNSVVFKLDDGSTAYASEIIQNKVGTLAQVGMTKDTALAFAKGVAADILTANWDAVGLSLDNALLLGNGNVARIDNGGTFLFRAQAGRKPDAVLDKITEWDKFFDPSINGSYAKVMAAAGYTDAESMGNVIADQIEQIRLLKISEGGWIGFVDRVAPGLSAADRDKIVQMLDARTDALIKKQKALLKPKTVAVPGTVPVNAAPLSLTASAELRKMVDLIVSHSYSWGSYEKTYQAKWYGNADLYTRVKGWVSKWAQSGFYGGSNWTQLTNAFKKVLDGKPITTATEKTVMQAYTTRQARWEAAANQLNIPFPSFFHVYRGVKDNDPSDPAFIKTVVAAWRNDTADLMYVKQSGIASWSIDDSAAKSFAGGSYASNSVLYEAYVPFRQTLFDQIVDDGSFVSSFTSEHEVVVGDARDNAIVVSKDKVTVKFGGTLYTYKDRQKLFDAWKTKFGALPDASDFDMTLVDPNHPSLTP